MCIRDSKYTAVDANKVSELGEEAAKETNQKIKIARQDALAKVTIFPIAMLIAYVSLFLYFKRRGGYKTDEIGGGGGEESGLGGSESVETPSDEGGSS